MHFASPAVLPGPRVTLGGNKTLVPSSSFNIIAEPDSAVIPCRWVGAGPGSPSGTWDDIWLSPAAASGLFEVRCTLVSGPSDGWGVATTFGTWLALSATRIWSRAAPVNAVLRFEIRRVGFTSILSTCDVTLST